jgi:tetratricopeptide (TPR) repeat protein
MLLRLIMIAMKKSAFFLPMLLALSASAQTMDHNAMQTLSATSAERLGTVSFPISCAAATQVPFDRGVALLHDFWYDEANRQFRMLVDNNPKCAMAHWGVAMSVFHQIWGRPSADSMKLGWAEIRKAQSIKGGTEREREYIAALAVFYKPGKAEYPARIDAYSDAMGKLYVKYPDDVDAGAFYALSLLADESPTDTTLAQEHKAMAVLTPLFVKYPDNPGVVHYIIHACDNPAMAAEGLAAADHYGEIAQSGPHAFHMPGHIYARLGLWPQDIASQRGSIQASQVAEAHGESGVSDEPHSYDFLIYAYLQSGQDIKAKAALKEASVAVNGLASMSGAGMNHMAGMVPYYRTKLPVFYALEMRDWKTAAAMEPVAGSTPETSTLVYWARSVAHGHLRQPEQAQADLAKYDELIAEIRKGKNAYEADGTSAKLTRNEIVAWTAFAANKQEDALTAMRSAADLQDKVGQGEVDIPAREMLADMLLELGRPKEALEEYAVALKLSPNRLNGLYGAGRAAEAAGEKAKAEFYYAALLKSTDNGSDSARPEFVHAKSFVGSLQMAAR